MVLVTCDMHECLIEFYPFTGSERVVEIYVNAPLFERAFKNRGLLYKHLNIDDVQEACIVDADVLCITLNNRLAHMRIQQMCSKLSNNKRKYKFLMMVQNKYSIFYWCDLIAGLVNKSSRDGYSYMYIQALLKKMYCKKSEIYQVYPSLLHPQNIRHIKQQNHNHIISRTGRVKKKRVFRKCIAVLIELIMIRKLNIYKFAPGWIITGTLGA